MSSDLVSSGANSRMVHSLIVQRDSRSEPCAYFRNEALDKAQRACRALRARPVAFPHLNAGVGMCRLKITMDGKIAVLAVAGKGLVRGSGEIPRHHKLRRPQTGPRHGRAARADTAYERTHMLDLNPIPPWGREARIPGGVLSVLAIDDKKGWVSFDDD
jgi:hypothetical protein